MHFPRFLFLMPFFLSVSVVAHTQAEAHSSVEDRDQAPMLSRRPSISVLRGQPSSLSQSIDLILPEGTPLRIGMTNRVRLARAGTPVIGKVIDTVYVFDEPVIPAGSLALGKVRCIAPVSKLRRTTAAANADFSPRRDYVVGFESLILPDGRSLPIRTVASSGTPETVHLVTSSARIKKKNLAAQAIASAHQEIHNQLQTASTEITSPGRMHRLKQYVFAQMPYRHQYLEPGTQFIADLDQPINFGSTARMPAQLRSIGSEPEPGSTLRARLASELSSLNSRAGTPVEALVVDPMFASSGQLVLPAGTHIVGQVTQAKPAGRFHRNGLLRMSFDKIVTADGKQQEMKGALEGAEVDRTGNLKLDEEGGARATDNKSRYFSTAISVSIAVVASHPESDNGAPDGFSDPASRTVAGASGFRLVGALVSFASGSKAFSSMLGFYGAGFSIYRHFLARGKDVVFPKDTRVEIGFGLPHELSQAPAK